MQVVAVVRNITVVGDQVVLVVGVVVALLELLL
jgi:hypothetical protein